MADPALDKIQSGYKGEYDKAIAGGQSESDFVKSNTFGNYQTQLNNYYGGLTDPNQIAEQIAHQSGRTGDATYGSSAAALLSTLNARKTALASAAPTAPPATAPGLVASPQAPPAATPQPSPFKPTGVATGNPGQDTGGTYTAQNQSVESRIPGLMSTDNPIVATAVGQATRAANARGLQNSTMATQAGVQAAEASVLPIASQDAAQVASQNLSAQNAAQTGGLQEQQIGGTLQNTALNIQAARDNLNTQIASNQALLTQSLGSQATLQAAQLAMNKQLAGQQLDAQEKMLVQQLDASMKQLGLSTSTQIQVANSNIQAGQQQQVATGAGQYAAIYQDAVNQINANKDLPADARAAALTSVQAQYTSNMNFLSQLYNVTLTWTTTGPDGTKTTNVTEPKKAA